MPIYEFKCLSCNECFEILVLKKDEEVAASCPKCGSEEFERVMSKTCFAVAPSGGQGLRRVRQDPDLLRWVLHDVGDPRAFPLILPHLYAVRTFHPFELTGR